MKPGKPKPTRRSEIERKAAADSRQIALPLGQPNAAPPASDSITILETRPPLVAAKRIRLKAEEPPIVTPYDAGKHFRVHERPVGFIGDVAALLGKVEQQTRFFVIRGRPTAGIDRATALRRIQGEGACFETAARYWIPLDLDDLPCPPGLDPLAKPEDAVRVAVAVLPAEFRGVTCWWQFTASAGFEPGIRLRLFFWGDRPTSDAELKAWLPPAVDPALFSPVQPIWVARPLFEGGDDPVPRRSGLLQGERDAVRVPEIAVEPICEVVGAAARCEGLSPYGAAALRSAAEKILAAPNGRQEATLNAEGFSIGRLAGAGGVPVALALEVLATAARQIPNYKPNDPWHPAKGEDAAEAKVRQAFTAGLARPRATTADIMAELDRIETEVGNV